MPNALVHETSPYLIQHSENPVDWLPWGATALERARRENKPILLSIGYAACHWCHVMAHESFEDPETARLMNDNFINIKVDREERPDLDTIYQNALALMGEQGGWPLTMFLAPDGAPFWGGTYFPPTARYGRPPFRDVLTAVAETYRREPEKVARNVSLLSDALQRLSRPADGLALDLDIPFLDAAAGHLLSAVDVDNGGLKGAPKFPQPTLFDFLWRAHLRTGREDLREAVTRTLDKMCYGGIYDHVGGGFSRYSVDDTWTVPHFEKMLYDNALLIDLLTLVWQETRMELYRQRVIETAEWVLREMIAEDGAFASSLDADTEGEEGRFYTWTIGDIERILGEDAPIFRRAFDTPPEGHLDGRIVLNRNKPQETSGANLERVLVRCLDRLHEARSQRPRPARDDKILADWNGLMIHALANAGFVFEQPRWIEAARLAFAVIEKHLDLEGRLGHSYRKGRLQRAGIIDDYAALSRAALTLFEITAESRYLDAARRWVAAANTHYWDSENGGYFLTADDAERLVTRPKTAFDAPTPSGNGLMAQVLARLHLLTGEEDYRRRAEQTINAFSTAVREQFPHMTALLAGFEMLQTGRQVVVAGAPQDRQPFLRVLARRSLPNLVFAQTAGDGELPPGNPAHGKGPVGGKAAAYVCEAQTCRPPMTDPEALRKHLSAR